jgi:hypothetical protein
MKAKQKIYVVIAGLGLFLTSCYWNNWENLHTVSQTSSTNCKANDTSVVISYSVDIVPIVNSKCSATGCHQVGGSGTAKDYSFYGSSGSHGSGLDAVCSGDTTGSSAWHDITGFSGNPMPKTGSPPLTPCEKLILMRWIHSGAPNN